MLERKLGVAVALLACWTACSPTLPPTTIPQPPDPTFEPFKTVLQAYVDQTQPLRKQAAVSAERIPGKAGPTTAAETAVRTRQNELADALRLNLRPNAKQGDIFTPLIREFVGRWLEGYDVVWGARTGRDDGRLRSWGMSMFIPRASTSPGTRSYSTYRNSLAFSST